MGLEGEGFGSSRQTDKNPNRRLRRAARRSNRRRNQLAGGYRPSLADGKRRRTKRRARLTLLPLDEDEVQRLLVHASEGRARRVVTLMLETGIHPVVLSEPEHYSLRLHGMNGRDLVWYRPKTESLCRWRIPRGLRDLVRAVLQLDLGFTTQTYRNDLIAAVERAKMRRRVSPLTLRHTCLVRAFVVHKMTPQEVRDLLQCSERVLWENYSRLNRSVDLSALDDEDE